MGLADDFCANGFVVVRGAVAATWTKPVILSV
jgi:hypothetical protein